MTFFFIYSLSTSKIIQITLYRYFQNKISELISMLEHLKLPHIPLHISLNPSFRVYRISEGTMAQKRDFGCFSLNSFI
jgi:hypothetical protein